MSAGPVCAGPARSASADRLAGVAEDVETGIAVAEEKQRRALAVPEAVGERAPEVDAALGDEEAHFPDSLRLAEVHDPGPGVVVRDIREERAEPNPPTGEHIRAVHALLPARYRLLLLVLDATGMRVGELEALTWGDVDEPRSRWRVSQAVSKTGRARWVGVPPVLLEAVGGLVRRDDRVSERRVFQGFGADRFRTAITRACRAAGIPTVSPHDLRHRRISLLHLAGAPWARIGEHVGQRNLAVTANTYTHVLADETELDYASLLA
jgi:integrase